MRRRSSTLTLIAAVALATSLGLAAGAGARQQEQQQRPLVPSRAVLIESARNAINADWLTEDERRDARIFHGVWTDDDLDTPMRRAMVALNNWDFGHPSLSDPNVPAEIRAEAMLEAGEMRRAIEILEGARSNRAARIRAEAYESLGQFKRADNAVNEPVRRLTRRQVDDAEDLTEGVKALFVRSRLQGQPARDFQTMLELLGRAHQELDRFYWPAKLAEAELLLDKDHTPEAVAALHETLDLNPRCADAWYMLGRIALVHMYDQDAAERAAHAIRRLRQDHPMADLLEAEILLYRQDADGALVALHRLLERIPNLRAAHALIAAAEARRYNELGMRVALAKYDELSPGSPQAYFVAGRHMSLDRQYRLAAELLEEAIFRQPAWPAPQIELGLLELQSGRDARALDALQEVVQLDPFNKRAVNSLFLLEELAGYKQIETEHFVIRYKPGIDEVMVDLMPPVLEAIHERVARRFGHETGVKTVIELMPDHKRFGVRITGMPWIHTIAASTGPVIAMEVPREGPPSLHLGVFDWPRVLQHEYTHTITLSQTRNRIPHWLTEAAAVRMELAPRDYETCLVLADSYRKGTLFDLHEINWAFIRPRQPGDRSKAYAQGAWMVEYMTERYGESALVRLLDQYFDGAREQDAIPDALGVSREQFFIDFLDWAADQVDAWGLNSKPTLTELTDALRWADPELSKVMRTSRQARLDALVRAMTERIGRPVRGRRHALTADQWPEMVRPPVEIPDEAIAEWMDAYTDHPDLLELRLRRIIERRGGPDEGLVEQLNHYAGLRPVDTYPHRKLAQIWLATDHRQRAIPHLEALDIREQKTPIYALELAKLYRAEGDLERALQKMTRVLHFNPYHAPNREEAAMIAIEAGDLQAARMHIKALTLIEPDRPQHARRLAAIDQMIERQGQ